MWWLRPLAKSPPRGWSSSKACIHLLRVHWDSYSRLRENGRLKLFWIFEGKLNGFQYKRIWLFQSMNTWRAKTDLATPKPHQTFSHTINFFQKKKKKKPWKELFLKSKLNVQEKYNGKYISKQNTLVHGEMCLQLHLKLVCQLAHASKSCRFYRASVLTGPESSNRSK